LTIVAQPTPIAAFLSAQSYLYLYSWFNYLLDGNDQFSLPANANNADIEVGAGGTASIFGGGNSSVWIWHQKNIFWNDTGTDNALVFDAQVGSYDAPAGELFLNLASGTGSNPWGGTLSFQGVNQIAVGSIAGNEYIICNNNGDTINFGFATADYAGNALIVGGSGNDTLYGTNGDFVGSSFTDVIVAGRGTDTLAGGVAADSSYSVTNIFSYNLGKDTITNFVAGSTSGDVIDLSAVPGISDFADVQSRMSQPGANTVITFGTGETITLDDVSKGNLTSGNFLFAPEAAYAFLQPDLETTASTAVNELLEADTGQTEKIYLAMTGAFTVNTSGGTPTLDFTDGTSATYDAAATSSADHVLVFDYTVSSGYSDPDLTIENVVSGGAVIKGANGQSVNFSPVASQSLGLQINPTPLYVTSVAVTSAGTALTSGTEVDSGGTVTITLDMSESGFTTSDGNPYLALNDGEYAIFAGSSGNQLNFTYTVAEGDSTSNLTITGVDQGAVGGPSYSDFTDSGGYVADFTSAANYATGLQIGPVLFASAIATDATIDPGTGEGLVTSGGTLHLTLGMNQGVTVSGTPVLSLNDGGSATYDSALSDPGDGFLTFDYVVGGGESTPDLYATGASGGSIVTSGGVAANFDNLSLLSTGVEVGSSPLAVESFSASTTGHLNVGDTAYFTLKMSEPFTYNYEDFYLDLNDGEQAYFYSATSNTVVFDYTVGNTGTDVHTSNLEITDLNLGGGGGDPSAIVTDSAGNPADISAAIDVPTGISIGNPLALNSIATTWTSPEADAGSTVIIMLDMTEGATVNTAKGSPTLTLNDGATATYDPSASNLSGGQIAFAYAVGAHDSTSFLSVTGIDLNGAVIEDAAHNTADLTFPEPAALQTGSDSYTYPLQIALGRYTYPLQIGPLMVTSVMTSQLGEVDTGTVLKIEINFTDPITLNTSNGTPTLTLSDGGTATLDAGLMSDGTAESEGSLIFDYTPAAGNPTSNLEIASVNLNSATVEDTLNGSEVNFAGALNTPFDVSINTPLLLPTPPSLSVSTLSHTQTAADLKSGGTVTITLDMSEEDLKVSGTPELTLNDGGVASYVASASNPTTSGILVFKYTVSAGQDTSDLQVTGVTSGGWSVTDSAGNAANFSGAVADLGLVVDTNTPKVTGVSAIPGSGSSVGLDQTVKIDLDFSDAPLVVSGTPTLKLSDGGTAIYDASSSTPTSGTLEFDYMVSSGQHTADLTVTGITVPSGGSVKDLAGNAASPTLTTIEENLHLTINGIPPVVTSASASPSVVGSGGTAVITLKLSEAVTVSGTPVLDLNDGGSASYVGGGGTTTLTFDYVPGAEITSALAITGINESGGTIKDSAGNELSTSLTSALKIAVNIDSWARGSSGDFSSGADWTLGAPPTSSQDASIAIAGAYTVSVGSGANDTVAALTIGDKTATLLVSSGGTFSATNGTGTGANSGTIDVGDGAVLALGGTFVNDGTINLSGIPTATTVLDVAGTQLTLSGTGTVILTDAEAVGIVAGSNGTILTNAGNVIAGAGSIGAADKLSLINDGIIDADTSSSLTIRTGSNTIVNSATLEATASGGLVIDSNVSNTKTIEALGTNAEVVLNDDTVSNTGSGSIAALGGGAAVILDVDDILGGTLKTSGKNAAINVTAASDISGGTIAGGSLVEVTSGALLTLTGTAMVSSGATVSVTSGSTAIVSGPATIGKGGMVVVGSGGTAIVSGGAANSGTLYASGSGGLVQISGAVTGGGVAEIGNGVANIQSSGESVTFASGGSGQLQIFDTTGDTSDYSGKISGFGKNVSQSIDLISAVVSSGANVSATYSLSYTSMSTTSGTLVVTSGGTANVIADITLVGSYKTANFALKADFASAGATSGTLEIVDPPVGVHSANVWLFGQYIAGGFVIAPGSVAGAASAEGWPTSGQQSLLAHPHG
jgi:hypothetical protein